MKQVAPFSNRHSREEEEECVPVLRNEAPWYLHYNQGHGCQVSKHTAVTTSRPCKSTLQGAHGVYLVQKTHFLGFLYKYLLLYLLCLLPRGGKVIFNNS